MSDCREIESRLVAFIDDELAGTARDAVASHLEACPGCRAIVEAHHAVDRALDADEAPAPLRSMWPVIEKRRAAHAGMFDLRFATAAAVALVVGFTLGVLTYGGRSTESSGSTSVASSVVSTTDTDWATGSGPTLSDAYDFDASVASQ
jgi:anti-sigma factor RsiW